MALNTVTAFSSANLTVTASYQDVPGCTVSLTAGIWAIFAVANVVNAGASNTLRLKLYNFTDTVDLCGSVHGTSGGGFSQVGTPQYTLTIAATKSIRLAAIQQGGGFTVQRYSEGTIPATYINAIQVA